jgi:hypothetical protein
LQVGAHEKGGVEGEVGRFRRRHLVPVPAVADLAELNAPLAEADRFDASRRIARRTETVAEALAAEVPHLGVLPAEPFGCFVELSAKAERWRAVDMARLASRDTVVTLATVDNGHQRSTTMQSESDQHAD